MLTPAEAARQVCLFFCWKLLGLFHVLENLENDQPKIIGSTCFSFQSRQHKPCHDAYNPGAPRGRDPYVRDSIHPSPIAGSCSCESSATHTGLGGARGPNEVTRIRHARLIFIMLWLFYLAHAALKHRELIWLRFPEITAHLLQRWNAN